MKTWLDVYSTLFQGQKIARTISTCFEVANCQITFLVSVFSESLWIVLQWQSARPERRKAELRHAFSTCVYCICLRFLSNYVGLSQPKVLLRKRNSMQFSTKSFPQIRTLVPWLKSTLLLKIKCFDTHIYMKSYGLQTNETQHCL